MARCRVVLVNGPFGAGKTTVAEYIAEVNPTYRVCDWDDVAINTSTNLEKPERTKIRLKNLLVLLRQTIRSGYSVIIPNTINEHDIINAIKIATENKGAGFTHVVLDIDETTCMTRLSSRKNKGSITDASTANAIKKLKQFHSSENTIRLNSSDSTEEVYRKLSKYL